MKRIRDVEEYYDDEFDEEQKTRSRHFKKDKEKEQEKRKWDREDHYRRPQDYEDY